MTRARCCGPWCSRRRHHDRDGRWFSVRIMPYRTLDNRIDGVVITFIDITAAKTLEATLRKQQIGDAGGANEAA